MRVKAEIKSARGVHNALENFGKRISLSAIEQAAQETADFVWDKFTEAEYAGEDPTTDLYVDVEETGPLSRQVVAEGPLVGFIEYGTGVRSTRGGKGRALWFFSGQGRDIVENDYVEQARPVERSYSFIRDVSGEVDKDDTPYTDYRDDIWVTRGNPPNYIMQQAREFFLERVQELTNERKR